MLEKIEFYKAGKNKFEDAALDRLDKLWNNKK
jgi:hypothetical protein